MIFKGKNHYTILEIAIFSSIEEIKRGFRILAKRYHPDMPNGDRKKFEFARISYEAICDKEKKEVYDIWLKDRLYQKKSKNNFNKKYSKNNVDDIDNEMKCDIIMAWAEENPKFDTSFVMSIQDKIQDGYHLSFAQINALDNILIRFHIDVEYWKEKI